MTIHELSQRQCSIFPPEIFMRTVNYLNSLETEQWINRYLMQSVQIEDHGIVNAGWYTILERRK